MNKNMQENFDKLERRIKDCFNESDIERINYELSKIQTPTLTSGVGGSSVVSNYASKVLNEKNGIITRNIEPRDMIYLNTIGYENVLACSYSGNNYGVDTTFLKDLKKYLLSSKENNKEGITNLTYTCTDEEHSFISLGATLIPISILLNYYLDNDKNKVLSSIEIPTFDFDTKSEVYEIFSGLETSTSSAFLESTFTESGIAIPLVHDKYAYCHGRSTLSTTMTNNAIYFNLRTDLDKLLIEELKKYYKEVIVLDSKPDLYSEYKLLIKCMYLSKYISEQKQKDLSKVEYSQIVKKLYRYRGSM